MEFFMLKKVFFFSYFDRKQIKRKIDFFDQKHGLEKCDLLSIFSKLVLTGNK